jgi:transposase-like protein
VERPPTSYDGARMRRYKFTPETRKTICDLISSGVYPYIAAEVAGITRVTFWRWMRAAEEAEEILEALEASKVTELRKRAKEMGLPVDGRSKKEDLVRRLGSVHIELLEFRENVIRASAFARAVAEAKVLETRPFEWLSRGPGRQDWAPESKEVPDPVETPTTTEGEKVLEAPAPAFAAEVLRVLVDVGVLPNVVPIREDGGDDGANVDERAVPRGASRTS